VASDNARDGSVYDILYADTRRLSSLLSQFSDDGLLVELSRAAEDAHSVSAGLSIKVVKGDTSSTGKSGSTRKIDPQWLLPLLFLDAAKDLIERDIEQAALGSLVLAQGRLIVTDLRILQKLWSSPTAKKFVLQQIKDAERDKAREAAANEGENRASRRLAGKKQSEASASEADLIMELLPLLPHSPQVNIVSPDSTVWSTIEPDYLVGTVEDIMLKHGAKVPGGWSMVGILDARPWEEREDEDYDDILTFDDQISIGMHGMDNIWKIATGLGWPARQALGRPLLSYGVTPLIIFREIERGADATIAEAESATDPVVDGK
jgi:hypothetical protein